VVLAGALAAGAAQSADASDTTLERTFVRCVVQLRATHDPRKLEPALVRTVAAIRGESGSTARGRAAHKLAVRGFTWTLRGVRAELAFVRNDSGNVEAATRDARRAYNALEQGAGLLRRAGRLLGLRVGTLNGH
jgi:hypothetical protein